MIRSNIVNKRSFMVGMTLSLALLFAGTSALAVPASFMYQGRIVGSNGQPLEYGAVSFEFTVTSPDGNCVLYKEQRNGVDMRNSKGVFDTPIGTGTKSYPSTPSFTLLQAFSNSATLTCDGGATYTPAGDDGRRLRVQFFDGTGWKLISPDQVIRSVPFAGFAGVADSATKLGNKTANDFILKSTLPAPCAGTEVLSFDGTNFVCVIDQGGTGSTGTVTSVAAGTGLTGGPITTTGTLSVDVGVTTGKILQVAASDKLPVIDGSNLTNLTISQVTGTVPIAKGGTGQTSADAALNALLPAQTAGTFLKTNGTTPSFAMLRASDIKANSAGNPAFFNVSGACAAGEMITYSAVTDQLSCAAYTLPTAVTGNLWSGASGNVYRTSGRVGIGTNAPSAMLDVSGTSANIFLTDADGTKGANIDSNIVFKDQYNVSVADIGFQGTRDLLIRNDDQGVNFATGGTANRLVIRGDGNVGVGTNAPSEKLEVVGKVKATELCIGTDCKSAWPTAGGGGDVTNGGNTVSATMNIGTNSNHHLSLETNGSPRVTIKNNGYVGIGHTDPTSPLTVEHHSSDGNGMKAIDTFFKTEPTAASNQNFIGTNHYSEAAGSQYTGDFMGLSSTAVSKASSTVNSVTGLNIEAYQSNAGGHSNYVVGAQINSYSDQGSIGNLRGVMNNLTNHNGFDVSSMRGQENNLSNNNAGNVDEMMGFYTRIENNGAGTVNNGYGIYIDQPSNGGSGAITSWYGIYLRTPTAPAASYSIYSQGGRNYFGGNVGLGVTNPTEKLEVAGKVKATELCIGTDCKSAWPTGGGAGTVTSVTAGTGLTGGPITSSGTLNVDVGVTTGKILQVAASDKLPVIDGSNLINLTFSQVTGTLPIAKGGTGQTTADAALNALLPAQTAGAVLKTDGTTPSFGLLRISDVKANSVGNPSFLNASGGCSSGEMLTYSAVTDQISCAPYTLASAITTNLWSGSSGNVYRTSGNVGVGTSSPSSLLHLAGTSNVTLKVDSSNAAGTAISLSNSTSGAHTYQFYTTGSGSGSGAGLFGVYDETANKTPLAINGLAGKINTHANGQFGWSTGTDFAEGGNDTALSRNAAGVVEINNGSAGTLRDLRLRALNPGGEHVGIGTQNPTELLTIATSTADSGILVEGNFDNNDSVNLNFHRSRGTASSKTALQAGDEIWNMLSQGYSPSGGYSWSSGIISTVDGTPSGSNVPGDFQFYTNNGSGWGKRMVLSAAGNLGVGQDNPSEKLDVAGKVKANEFCIGASCISAWPGAGSAAWSEASGNAYRATGRVGIGNSNPGVTLDVTGIARVGSTATLKDSDHTSLVVAPPNGSYGGIEMNGGRGAGGAQSSYINFLNSGSYIASINAYTGTTTTSGTLTFETGVAGALTEKMRIDQTGNVGIGVTAPLRTLHVGGPMRIVASTAPGTPVAGDMYVDSGDSNKLKWYDGSTWKEAGGTAGGSSQWTTTGSHIYYSTGRVGIGTSSPSVPLDVVGDVRTSTAFYAPTGYIAKNYSNSQSSGQPGYSFVYSGDTGMFEADSAGSHALGFSTAGSERMRISANGKVGVGTIAPAGALEVASTTGAFIPPRMTASQRDALASVDGSIIYNSTTGRLNVMESGGWRELTTNAGDELSVLNTANLGASSSPVSTYTFPGLSFGTASDDRHMVAVMAGGHVNSGGSFSVSSLTIGGVAAAKIVELTGTSHRGVSIWIARVPAGTSGDVVANYSTTNSYRAVHLYRVSGLNSITPLTTTTAQGTATSVTASVDVSKKSVLIIGAASWNVAGLTYTWTGATKDSQLASDATYLSASSSAVFYSPYAAAAYPVTATTSSSAWTTMVGVVLK